MSDEHNEKEGKMKVSNMHRNLTLQLTFYSYFKINGGHDNNEKAIKKTFRNRR